MHASTSAFERLPSESANTCEMSAARTPARVGETNAFGDHSLDQRSSFHSSWRAAPRPARAALIYSSSKPPQEVECRMYFRAS